MAAGLRAMYRRQFKSRARDPQNTAQDLLSPSTDTTTPELFRVIILFVSQNRKIQDAHVDNINGVASQETENLLADEHN